MEADGNEHVPEETEEGSAGKRIDDHFTGNARGKGLDYNEVDLRSNRRHSLREPWSPSTAEQRLLERKHMTGEAPPGCPQERGTCYLL